MLPIGPFGIVVPIYCLQASQFGPVSKDRSVPQPSPIVSSQRTAINHVVPAAPIAASAFLLLLVHHRRRVPSCSYVLSTR
ncbi:hypothetical protein TNCT_433551 [Trichonephila clavata]|uniref:Uncharacterized protein n=1 Tax=Trichonephila clavata TaxID=2740835 RepID=A0A8X6LGC7_TRICU|nr:hypothetical protein TNCT_433551 [Trichonephila clavata]